MKRVNNLSLFYSAGFLPAIFHNKQHIGNLFVDGQITSDHHFDGDVVVVDANGDIVSDIFDGDVFILAVTSNDYRKDCKVPGGSSKEGEDEYQTLLREIKEETYCDVRRALQFRKETYGNHSKNFFFIDMIPNLPLNDVCFSHTGRERLKIYWIDIVNFSCCLFKNQRYAFKQFVRILSKNETFVEKYHGLVSITGDYN